MPYMKTHVFPIREVEKLANIIGGKFRVTIQAIQDWITQNRRSLPRALGNPPVSYEPDRFSQLKRLLYYRALKGFDQRCPSLNLWDRFVREHWPKATTPSGQTKIRWLEEDFINSGLVAKHKHRLPPEAQNLIP